jgi:hypothetical protein
MVAHLLCGINPLAAKAPAEWRDGEKVVLSPIDDIANQSRRDPLKVAKNGGNHERHPVEKDPENKLG